MWLLYFIGAVLLLILFNFIKEAVWDKPKERIHSLESTIEKLQQLHKDTLNKLNVRLQNSKDIRIQGNDYADIVAFAAWNEISILSSEKFGFLRIPKANGASEWNRDNIIEAIKKRFEEAIVEQYKFRFLSYLYPELMKIFSGTEIVTAIPGQPGTISRRLENIFDVVNLLRGNEKPANELILLKNRVSFLEASKSNLTAIPYMSRIMADYETYGLERLAKELDWGYAVKRIDKVKTIREIRRDAQAMVEKNKESQYQLGYLLRLFPSLEDVIDAEFSQLPVINVSDISEYDYAKDFLSNEEYASLDTCKKNQLALDRYKKSHKRTKWQVGRDYELFVGYTFAQKGYEVDYFGSYMGLEDLGRDIIAKKNGNTIIVQCKYWSVNKQIHENYITQLYGTVACYCIENNLDKKHVNGMLVTNIQLSPMAKKMASYLGMDYVENFGIGDYPCIKCNVSIDEFGARTLIYHLPFDQQYDSTKISKKGEFFAMTVAEAESAGFRRAFRWFGNR